MIENQELVKLSPPEYKVVELVSQGKTNQQIADELNVSRRTIETHMYHIFQKVDIQGKRNKRTIIAHEFLTNNQRYVCMPPYSGNYKAIKLRYGHWQVISRKRQQVECKCLLCDQIYTRWLANLKNGSSKKCRNCSSKVGKG